MGEPSGDRLEASDLGLLKISVVPADPGTVSSETTAVVATALAAPGVPPAKGSLALENRDEEDIRDARDPDLRGRGSGAVLVCGVALLATVRDGDGEGCCGCGGGEAAEGG